jgi:Ubiquitin family
MPAPGRRPVTDKDSPSRGPRWFREGTSFGDTRTPRGARSVDGIPPANTRESCGRPWFEWMADNSGEVAADAEPGVLRLLVRCTDNTSASLELAPTASVGDLKYSFWSSSKEAPTHAPGLQRCIFAGRLLEDDAQQLLQAGLTDGCCVHVALRSADAERAATGAEASPADDQSAAGSSPEAQVLQAALELQLAVLAERAAQQRRRRGNVGESSPPLGDMGDLWLGVSLGLLLGLVSAVCLTHPSASSRLKTGIIIGVFINMSGLLNATSGGHGTSGNVVD